MQYPSKGGSYIRNPDGTLTLVEESTKPAAVDTPVKEPKSNPSSQPSLTESDNG